MESNSKGIVGQLINYDSNGMGSFRGTVQSAQAAEADAAYLNGRRLVSE